MCGVVCGKGPDFQMSPCLNLVICYWLFHAAVTLPEELFHPTIKHTSKSVCVSLNVCVCMYMWQQAVLADRQCRHQSRKLEAAFNTCLHKGVISEAAAAQKNIKNKGKKIILMGNWGDYTFFLLFLRSVNLYMFLCCSIKTKSSLVKPLQKQSLTWRVAPRCDQYYWIFSTRREHDKWRAISTGEKGGRKFLQ